MNPSTQLRATNRPAASAPAPVPSPQPADLSILIVNYNVKEFLVNALQSVRRASKGLVVQTIVVDNASSDGSRDLLPGLFPEVDFIWLEENLGFGKANNRGLERVTGAYTLLLNPDTLLQEDTLHVLKAHMDAREGVGVCGCKILNPDGSFAPESRRSVPTIASSFHKAIGLTALFPKSRTFGRYYLGWLSEDEPGEVPVLSGSFMFFRTAVLRDLGGFDERFFMYGEDIDLCVRVKQAGWGIDYVPTTSIIHYKGESSRKDDIRYIRHFNQALYLFFEKHVSSGSPTLFRAAIGLAILIRAVLSFVNQKLKVFRSIALDLVLVNAALFVALGLRWSFDLEKLQTIDYGQFVWLNAMVTALYLVFGQLTDLVRQNRFEVSSALKSVVGAYATLILITFFARELAFSRIIVSAALVISLAGVGSVRLWSVNRPNRLAAGHGRWVRSRILMVGVGERTYDAVRRIRSSSELNAEVLGILHQEQWTPTEAGGSAAPSLAGDSTTHPETGDSIIPSLVIDTPVIGSLSQIRQIVDDLDISHVIFVMDAVQHAEFLSGLTRLRDTAVTVRILPQEMDVLLGKAEMEYLEDLPLMEVPLGFLNPVQRSLKRLMDLIIAVPLVIIGAPFLAPLWMWRAWRTRRRGTQESERLSIFDGRRFHEVELMHPIARHRVLNSWRLLIDVVIGRMSLVGSSLHRLQDSSSKSEEPLYRTGLLSYAMLHRERIRTAQDLQRFEQYYMRHYSFWLDVEILIRGFNRSGRD